MNNKALSLRDLVLYPLPAIFLAAVGLTVNVYLPKYYIDEVGIGALFFGVLIIVIKLSDALLNPLIGRLSDRLADYRKPIMLGSAMVFALTFFLISAPELLIGESVRFVGYFLLTLTVAIFFLSWSILAIPYQSFGFLLTSKHHERTRVLGLREGATLVGTVLAAVLPVVFGQENFGYFELLSWVYGVGIIGSLLLIYFFLNPREPGGPEGAASRGGQSGDAPISPGMQQSAEASGIRAYYQNPGFRVLLITYGLTSFGATLSGATIYFYVDYVLQSNYVKEFILLYFVFGILFLPFWIYWSARVGKYQAWLQSLILGTVAFGLINFLGSGDQYLYLALILLSSVGLGGILAIPASLQADVAEDYGKDAGQNSDSSLVGYWVLAKKIAAAISGGLAFPLLQFSGYQPNASQTDLVLRVITLNYAFIPFCCYAGAAIFIYIYRTELKELSVKQV